MLLLGVKLTDVFPILPPNLDDGRGIALDVSLITTPLRESANLCSKARIRANMSPIIDFEALTFNDGSFVTMDRRGVSVARLARSRDERIDGNAARDAAMDGLVPVLELGRRLVRDEGRCLASKSFN